MKVALLVGRVLVLQNVPETELVAGQFFTAAQMRREAAQIHFVRVDQVVCEIDLAAGIASNRLWVGLQTSIRRLAMHFLV